MLPSVIVIKYPPPNFGRGAEDDGDRNLFHQQYFPQARELK